MRQNWQAGIFALIAIAYLLWYAWPIVWAISDNARLVYAFNTDEGTHVELIADALARNSLKIDFGFYGHLYFYLALAPLFIIKGFMPVTDQMIIVILRLIPVIFSAGTILLIYSIGRRYIGGWAGWVSGGILAVVPLNYLQMSVISHPDLPQLFFMTASLFYACRMGETGREKYLFLSSLMAGLAFACKYSGLFLMPIILITYFFSAADPKMGIKPQGQSGSIIGLLRVLLAAIGTIMIGGAAVFSAKFIQNNLGIILDESSFGVHKMDLLFKLRVMSAAGGGGLVAAAFLNPLWNFIKSRALLLRVVEKAFYAIIIFFLAFLFVSPFSFYKFNIFKGMIYESAHTAYGDWFRESANGLIWFSVLASKDLLGILILGVLGCGLVMAVARIFKEGKNVLHEPVYVLWLWVLLFLVFLILKVQVRPPRYILPIIPAAIVLFVFSANQILSKIGNRWGIKKAMPAMVSIWAAVLAFEGATSIPNNLKLREGIIRWEAKSGSVAAGKWIAENYPAGTKILYDFYSYIPPVFQNIRPTWGGTLEILDTYSPELVVIQDAVAKKFRTKGETTPYAWGIQEYETIYKYYQMIEDGKAGYALVRDFESCRVYQKNKEFSQQSK